MRERATVRSWSPSPPGRRACCRAVLPATEGGDRPPLRREQAVVRVASFDGSHDARAAAPGAAVEDESAVQRDPHRVTATARSDHDDVSDFVCDHAGKEPATPGGDVLTRGEQQPSWAAAAAHVPAGSVGRDREVAEQPVGGLHEVRARGPKPLTVLLSESTPTTRSRAPRTTREPSVSAR